jgi:hypothetical protein
MRHDDNETIITKTVAAATILATVATTPKSDGTVRSMSMIIV